MVDDLLTEGVSFVSALPGAPEASKVQCRPCRLLKYGDLWVGRDVAAAIRANLPGEEALSDKLPVIKYSSDVFSAVKFNPQGQLCLSLNRPFTLRKIIEKVLDRGPCYGLHNSPNTRLTVLTSYTRLSEEESLGKESLGKAVSSQQLSVSEGRIILVKKLLSRLLSLTGHCVRESRLTDYSEERDEACSSDSKLEPADLAQQLFHSFLHETTPPTPPPTMGREEDDKFMSRMESSRFVHYSRLRLPHSLLCDGKSFTQEKGLLGRYSYDKSIDLIEVKTIEGTLSRAASLASTLCRMKATLAGEDSSAGDNVTMIHITSHAYSFKLQEAMVLADVFVDSACENQSPLFKQHVILCSGVEVLEDGVVTKDYPLAKLLQIRHHQMTAAYCVKYGDKAQGSGVQAMVGRTAEAVVKFELLSTDPQSKISLEVASQPSAGADVRFSGSFVLYNYARLANVLANFQRGCEKGTYPPLPDSSRIDFSLLSDEEEWHILFFYILQYPMMVREVSDSCSSDEYIRLETKLKKVCQFLTQLSHSVSAYYSRVKILMAPEPHLVPLIHARLQLVMAVKQVMYNALQLLAIDPPEQL